MGERAAELVQELVRSVVEGFTRLRTSVEQAVTQLKQRAIDGFNQLRSEIFGILGSLAGGAAERGAGMVRAFADGVIGALSSAIDAARRLAQELRDLLPGSDAKTGPLSDLTASGRGLPETLGQAISRGAPAALGAVETLAGGLTSVLSMDTASLGADAGMNWIEAMIKAIQSRLPALRETTAQAWEMLQPSRPNMLAPAYAGYSTRPSEPAREMPVTINMYGPWNVRNDKDIEAIGERVADYLARRTATTKRMQR